MHQNEMLSGNSPRQCFLIKLIIHLKLLKHAKHLKSGGVSFKTV